MEVSMAVMTIRNIDDAIKNRLRLRAAMHGRSMEDEARDILRSALSTEIPRPRNLGQAINERFDYSLGLHFTSIAHLGAFSDTSKITSYKFGEESQVTVISPQTFYYLNFPLRFSWNFSRKQCLGSSFELGYLLNVNSTVETYEAAFTDSEKQSSKELGYTEGVAPYNFQMGFFYRRELFKNLYIQPEVFFGLVDLKDDAFFNSNVKERSSGLKLTLLYSIKNR